MCRKNCIVYKHQTKLYVLIKYILYIIYYYTQPTATHNDEQTKFYKYFTYMLFSNMQSHRHHTYTQSEILFKKYFLSTIHIIYYNVFSIFTDQKNFHINTSHNYYLIIFCITKPVLEIVFSLDKKKIFFLRKMCFLHTYINLITPF